MLVPSRARAALGRTGGYAEAVNVSQSNGREKLLQSLRAGSRWLRPSNADAVIETLTEAMQVTKRAWGACGGCGQRVELQVMDATAAVMPPRC